jgi:four helix bundle protein
MKDQLRAAATSISSNIAEGFEYFNNRQFIRFLTYAKGSSSELFNQLSILHKAGMMSNEDFQMYSHKALELGNKIGGFIRYLRKY